MKNRTLRYLNFALTILLAGYVLVLVSQDHYELLQLRDWWSLLVSDYEQTDRTMFTTMYSIFVPIQISFFGILLAVLSIIIGKTRITLSSYIRHIAPLDWVVFSFIQYFISTILSIVTIYFRPTIATELWLKVSMVFPIVFVALFALNLSKIESKELLHALFVENIVSKRFSIGFFREVYLPYFRETIFESVSDVIREVSRKDVLSREVLYDRMKTINEEIEKVGL